MLFSVPICSPSTYTIEPPTSHVIGLDIILRFEPNSTAFNQTYEEFKRVELALDNPLIYLSVKNVNFTTDIDYNDLRANEQDLAYATNDPDSFAVYDIRKQMELEAGLAIGTTLFICVVLAAGALIFSNITSDLVISPIEQMITKVNRISQNPLLAAQEEENEALALEKMQEEEAKTHGGVVKQSHIPHGPVMETVLLEQTIVKIGALLALGFGEAGSKIIAENMAQGGDVNPMLPGQKIMAIFGLCAIRNFTDATEVL